MYLQAGELLMVSAGTGCVTGVQAGATHNSFVSIHSQRVCTLSLPSIRGLQCCCMSGSGRCTLVWAEVLV